MELYPLKPLAFVIAAVMGIISAYLAVKRAKNPYLWFAIGFFLGALGIFAILFITAAKKRPTEEAPQERLLSIDGPTDKFWYYLDPAHKTQGPMSKDAISDAWKSGKIDLSTFIWHEELADWKPLKETLRGHP